MVEPEAPSTVRKDLLTVPNALSFGRILATPLVFWLVVSGHTNWATALIGLCGISDYLDGHIARRTGTVTELGVTLDPVSDRVLVMALLIATLRAEILPLWLGIPVLAREVLISVVFLALARRGFGKPKVRRVGKTATAALLIALPALVLGRGPMRSIGLGFFVVGGLLYFVATYRYYQDVRRFLDRQRAPFGQ